MKITVTNWKTFNGRADIKHPSWFRVDYKMLEDPDFYNFTHEEFHAWFYILAQCCRRNSDTVVINFDHAKATARLSQQAIRSCVGKLLELNIINENDDDTLRARNVDVTQTLRARYATRQDSTRQYTNAHPASQDVRVSQGDLVNQVYGGYPKKIGKSRGMKILAKLKDDELAQAITAAKNYSDYCKANKIAKQFIKQFDTWAGEWRDWIVPPETLSPESSVQEYFKNYRPEIGGDDEAQT